MIDLRLFLQDCLIQGTELWAEGERLQVRPPQGGLSPEKLALLSQYESEILRLLPTFSFEIPLSYGQEALWVVHENTPNKGAYNTAVVLQLKNGVDKALLRDVFQKIVGRHSALRTTIVASNGKPKQVIHATQTLSFEQVDCSGQGMSRGTRDQEIVMQAVEEAYQRPFDLSEGPLWRVTLVTQSPDSHALLLSFHHIIFDGWSIWMLLDEFLALYAAGNTELATLAWRVNLPPITRTYAQFVQWQREFLKASLDELRVYWQKVLEGQEGQLPPLELPTDHPRPAFPTSQGNSVPFKLASELRDQLRALARRCGVSFYTVLLAAFQVLLARYSGQNQVLVGLPTAGRTEEFAQIFGYFVNEVVVRGDLENAPSFTTFLSQVRANLLGAIKHRAYPFSWLVRDLLPSERDPSRPPIFQAMLTVQRAQQLKDKTLRLLKGEQVPLGSASGAPMLSFVKWLQVTHNLDIELDLMEQNEGLVGYIRYNADIFEASTIERMGGHFKTLLAGILANPEQAVDQLPLLSETERHQLLVEWNKTDVACPTNHCFHELFEAQVVRTPDAQAVVDTLVGQMCTYRELNERANQLAHHLRALGVKPEVVVGVCMERCSESVISLLAIFKAGGVYVPLDPALPQERLEYMLTNSEAKVVLTKSQYASRLLGGEHNAQLLCFDTDWPRIAQEPKRNPVNLSTPQNLAYVIYTSGSTGLPKGAMIEHQNMVNHLYSKIIGLNITSNDHIAATAAQSFDISIWQFLVTLLVGGAVHIFDDETVRNPNQLLARMDAEKITHVEVVPSLFRFMLDELGRLGVNRHKFKALCSVRLSGEALPPHLCREWFSYYPNIPLINGYGPTECTDETTYHVIEQAPPPNALSIPIGRPISNAQVYILDATMQPVPIGVPGELYVGGMGVGRGYLNDPERTANAFMDDPFGDGRFYKTGDLVRYRPDGMIEFLGRLDYQVKVRGHRIELGEIESTLAKHPAVRQSLVIAKENGAADYSLVAYVAANPAPTVSEWRDYLSQTLPDYMIPAAFVTLDAFPLTPNGKVNRKALPMPTITLEQETTVRPETPTEEVLANIWAEVLSLKRVLRSENFFELGGHSLLAIQVISRLRSVFQVELSVRSVFESPTIAQLAQTIESARQTEQQWPVPPPILPVPRGEEALLPLSFAQQRLWFLDQLEGPSATYNISDAFRLTLSDQPSRACLPALPLAPLLIPRSSGHALGEGDLQGTLLQLDALEAALNQLTRRHEVLRTTFPTINGQPMQRIHPELRLPLTVIDLRFSPSPKVGRGGRGVRAELDHLLMQEVKRPFDLAQGPLLRAHLYLLSETEAVLQLTIHHIISDEWSTNVLIRELSALYQAALTDQASISANLLPDLPVQYADFAQWQREWLRGEVFERQLAYWQAQLAHAPTLLELPTDHPRPRVQTFNGQIERFELDAELTAQLVSLSRRLGSSSFMTYYAAFAVLMGRFSGQEDIVIGTPIANRQYREIEPLIGFFLNTLALRTDLSGNPSFADFAAQVRKLTLDAYAHQDIPFEQLVEELAIERNLSHSPLFQVMFVWLDESPPAMLGEEGQIKMERLLLPTVAAKFDLTLFLGHSEEIGDGSQTTSLWGMIEYNTDLFERATIERMIGHLRQLLHGIATMPQEPINQLPLLTEAERQQIVHSWNDTATDYPRDNCIHQLFEQQVERTPDAIAVVSPPELGGIKGGLRAQLTYRQLNQYSNQLAHHLRALGVGPDVLVGLSLPRSLEMMVGVLAILKAGGAYVPLDTAYPQERLSFMQRDAQIAVLLTHSQSDVYATEGTQVVYLDEIREQLALMPTENPHSGVSPENLLYVIYTSGSTGVPKGVAMPHRPLVNLISWQEQQSRAGLNRTLQFTPISFDVSCQELFSTWCSGGTLLLVDDDTRRDGEALLDYLNVHKIERLFLPFVALQAVAEYAQHAPPTALRDVITAGEQLQITPAIKKWFSQTDCTLHNQYGPTESHVITAYTLPPDVNEWATLPPIGTPIANGQTYILDSSAQPVPIGVVGELYLGGHALARGYQHRPDLTEERFVPNPFGPRRIYKTGDLARYLPDGNIEFLGRADHQVKIRGFRVELGEIEARLSQHPAVQEAAVVAREDERGNKRLVAYVVSSDMALTSDLSTLRAHLKAQLPDYMVPAAFVLLDALPLTPSGKINRRALPAPDEALGGLEEGYVAPATPTEEIVAAIWAELLGRKRVSREDNFFELGGHSLLATQVVSRLREAFQIALRVRTIFEAPTVAELAAAIERARQASQQLPVPPPMGALERVGKWPLDFALSFAQQRLWVLNQMTGSNPTYSLPMVLRLSGSLQVSILEQALGELVRRHEILRTTFPTVEGKPVQRINPYHPLSLPVVSLQHLSFATQTTELNRLVASEALRPFDLAQGPLLRVKLYVLSDQEESGGDYALFLNMQHIIADGWSLGILWQELDSLYQAFAASQPSPLPELSVQYADFAQWQRQWLQGEVLEKQLTYWQRQLADAPTLLELPADRPRKAVQTFNGQVELFEISAQLADNLRDLSQHSGTSLFMTLYGAFSVLLGRLCRQEDLVIGTPIANRNYQEIEPLIGFFVNSLPLRADLSGNPSFLELLARVRQVTLDAYSHQDLPFEQLVDQLAVERQLSHSPLFQVVLMWQNMPLTPTGLGDLTASLLEVDTVSAKFDLTLALGENDSIGAQGAALWGGIEYNTDLFERATIQRFIGHFKQLLAGIVADPTQAINELPILMPAERQQLLVEWNNTQTNYPVDKSINQLFEEQVARTPDAVAVLFGEAQLTYRELNQRANQLAHHLIKMGVGPEVLVGICVERSLDMVVGLLGILKAGGAYLPLDPNYPAERLAFMLDDAQVRVLLTQEHLLATLPNTSSHLVCLDRDWGSLATYPSQNLSNPVQSDHLAYVIYTSGSTGKPKGVMIEQRGLLNLVFWHQRAFQVTAADRVTQLASLSFDAAVWEIWPYLTAGASLHLVERDVLLSPIALRDWLLSQQITISFIPTPLTEKLLSLQWPAETVLRLLLTGGDKLHHFPSANLPFELINNYGPTENSVVATFGKVAPQGVDEPNGLGAPSIGRPIDNVQLYILDHNLQPVPIGIPGELHIGGDSLARGYLKRPRLTEERFIPNPFGPERLYKTGDLVRYLPNGNIEFLGRIDHQVKLRGFRIELGEIEAVLSQHPAVLATVVIVREDKPGAKQLVAYIIPQEEIEPRVPDLRARLKEALPDYMVPSAFVLLESLPLNPNGKVDRRALPTPAEAETVATLNEEYVSPQSDLEKAIANVWQELLNLPKAGIHDNFFDVGGHSLLAIQMHSTLQSTIAHAKEMSVTDLFRFPTIALLAEHLSSQAKKQTQTEPEAPLLQTSQNRSQARRQALKQRAKRKPRAKRRSRQ